MNNNASNASKSYKKSISKRLRNLNVFLFFIVTVIIFASMFILIKETTRKVSKDYARLYSENAVGILNNSLSSELKLIAKTANSNAIIEWFDDEANEIKKGSAYEEMMNTISVSSSKNLYIAINKSFHEFTVEYDNTLDDIASHATLSKELASDEWYFNCIENNNDYMLKVDIDKVYNSKRVWLNYKVARDNVVYGVICTGLEFSKVVEDLFAKYDNNFVRSLIIDEYGYVQMDSSLVVNDNFFYTLDTIDIKKEFSNKELLVALEDYIKPMESYYTTSDTTKVLELSDKDYQYATIAPIESTTWSVITLYNSAALFDVSTLMPLFIIIPLIFILFILSFNWTLSKLVLEPFNRVIRSVERVSINFNERVYGIEREDEIGELANSVQVMKDSLIDALSKVHYDSLTSIYNRRYFDENIRKLFNTLSRGDNKISVLLLDIDHFKYYNDTYGHNLGDECLKKVADILSKSVTRAGDFTARYGGEEFVIVLPNTGLNGATKIAQDILKSFKVANIPHETSKVEKYVTISIGVYTTIVQKDDTPEDYIKCADKALYQSKEHGRNRYTVYKD